MNIIGEIEVCTDCMLTDQQGGDYDNTPEQGQPEPWALMSGRYNAGQLVMGTEHHNESCHLNPENTENTDYMSYYDQSRECGHDDFSSARCEGCGTYLAGERFSYVIFDS
jgi:hypothetical protein